MATGKLSREKIELSIVLKTRKRECWRMPARGTEKLSVVSKASKEAMCKGF